VQKRYHFLKITVFVHATEDEEKIRGSLENLLGEPLPDDLEVTVTEGFHGNPIKIILLEYFRSRDIRRILSRWEDRDFWLDAKGDIDVRLDEDLTYHVRLDKQKACEGDLGLWRTGGAIDIQLKPATYPSSRNEALRIIENGPVDKKQDR
jgi:RNA binding exosome subunit